MFRTQTIRNASDEELLKWYREDASPKLLEELLGRYIRFVFLVCMKYLKDEDTAKDRSMQVFEKVMADIPRFEIQHFKSWLHVVTKNACLMHLRAQKGKKEMSLTDEKDWDWVVKNEPPVHHEYDHEREVQLQQLEAAIETLEDGQRQCIELFYLKEKSYVEVAETTGFTLNQVKSYIQNGKRNLHNLLVGRGDVLLMVLFRLMGF